jgi:hypothetical protein
MLRLFRLFLSIPSILLSLHIGTNGRRMIPTKPFPTQCQAQALAMDDGTSVCRIRVFGGARDRRPQRSTGVRSVPPSLRDIITLKAIC